MKASQSGDMNPSCSGETRRSRFRSRTFSGLMDIQSTTGGSPVSKIIRSLTFTDLFMSGHSISKEVPDEMRPPPDLSTVDYFPDPPCLAPFEDEDHRKSVQSTDKAPAPHDYFKAHSTWIDEPGCVSARARFASFLKLWRELVQDAAMSHDIFPEAFVNISSTSIGISSRPRSSKEYRTDEGIEPGECVMVDRLVQRGNVRFMRLADKRGWAFDRIGGELVMSKIEDVSVGLKWYRVLVKDAVEIRQAPADWSPHQTRRYLSPEELVVGDFRARVRGQSYVHLSDGRGWVLTTKPGLIGKQHSLDDTVLIDCEHEMGHGGWSFTREMMPATNEVVEVGSWHYSVGDKPVLALGFTTYGTYIKPGDIVRVDKRAFANGDALHNGRPSIRWLRLADKRGWVPEQDSSGKMLMISRADSDFTYPASFTGFVNLDVPPHPWMVGVV